MSEIVEPAPAKVVDLMTHPVWTCRPHDSLAEAVRLMHDHELGSVLVLDDTGAVAGIVTDRDVCLAAYRNGVPLRAIPVWTAMSRSIHACRLESSLAEAETMMKEHHVRRLPVIDDRGRLVGILSLDDLARASGHGDGHSLEVDAADVGSTLAGVCRREG